MNLSFEEGKERIKLLSFKTSDLTLETSIYIKGEFVRNREMVYTHLPKKIKSLLNKFF